jgi:HK97 gp10 family phage protein
VSVFAIELNNFEDLEQAILNYRGNVEEAINDVLHNEGGQLIHDEIKRLMPHSGSRTWKGKKRNAKDSNSLKIDKGNLSVMVRTQKSYQYLYFPDDGTNTVNHVGNQQFFKRGGESQTGEIIDRCVNRLVNVFEEAV